ncbi:MAG TPA: hypothetical protein VIJ18_00485 [Microbacteriaceae bacterium]
MSMVDEARYAHTADWAESLDSMLPDATIIDATIDQDGRKLIEDLYASSDAIERAMGRPSLDGRMTRGHSPRAPGSPAARPDVTPVSGSEAVAWWPRTSNPKRHAFPAGSCIETIDIPSG